jgi:hypothetical protein
MFEIVFERASESLLTVFRAGFDECARLENRWVCSEHLLLALTIDSDHVAGKALGTMKVNADAVQNEVDKQLKEKLGSEPMFTERSETIEAAATGDRPKLRVFSSEDAAHNGIAFSQIVIDALKRANDYSLFFGTEEVQPEHLLLGLLDIRDAGANRILEELAINVTFLRRQLMAISAEEAFRRPSVPTLREALLSGFNTLVERYQANVNTLINLSVRAGGVPVSTPSRGQIVHMVCLAYMGDFLNTQSAFQRYLLEENIKSLGKRLGTLDKEMQASIVSSGAQNLRAEVRSTIEHIFCNQYRLQTRTLDEAEHDTIGSVIEDLWWTQSEEIALNGLFAEALDDHRRKEILNLQKRRIELAQRLTKLRHRLEDTVRQCFVKHSISA